MKFLKTYQKVSSVSVFSLESGSERLSYGEIDRRGQVSGWEQVGAVMSVSSEEKFCYISLSFSRALSEIHSLKHSSYSL